ncbi:MAG: hypothetical protein A2Y10_02875 [Planctomycetes bacterium GWF2_41_51]|nr:MAG: hypothetical protein A2Y10_02875 [Planctomycetes bacterium GWF2_41_51]HBG27494.1 hypothetical protein [Phycisphaerales bacterium]
MSDEITQNEQQQMMERLLRNGEPMTENAFVTSAGGRNPGFVARVISKHNYNHYNVRACELRSAGLYPIAVGEEVRAVNVAEPFTSQGTLTAGKYVIMFKMGEYYCFYANA